MAAGRSIASGRPAEAIADLQAALETYRRTKNATGEVVTLMLLATTDLPNDGLARTRLEHALSLTRKRNDVLGTWLVLVHLAQLERSIGHYGAALARQDETWKVLEDAEASEDEFPLATLELMTKAFGLPGLALEDAPSGVGVFVQAIVLHYVAKPLTHNGSAGILIETGQYDRAERELTAASAGPNPYAEGFAPAMAANWGELRFRQRRFDEARAYYQTALTGAAQLPASALGDQWITVNLYGRLAELEVAEHHLDAAVAWNDRALDAVRSARNEQQENAVLEERGVLLVQSDRIAEAEAAFEQARDIASAIGDQRRQAYLERHLADVTFLGGKYGAAAAHLEETIRLQQTLHEPVDEGVAWVSLAVLYVLTSNDDAADALLTQADQLAARSPVEFVCDVTRFLQTVQKHRKGAATRSELSGAFRDLIANPQMRSADIHGDGERALRESLSLDSSASSAAGSNHPISIYQGLAYAGEGKRQLENGNTAAARRLYEKALQANATGELCARYQAAIGNSHWHDGNIDAAIRSFSDAAATLDTVVGDLRAESMLTSFLGSDDHRAYYDVLIEALLRNQQPEKAFEVTERARARAFLRSRGRRQASSLTRTIDELQHQIENWTASPVPGETLSGLRRRYDVLRSRSQSAGAAEIGIEPLALAEIWNELPSDTTLLSYFISPLGAHAWIVDNEGVEHVSLGLTNGELKRIVCWATELGREQKAKPRGVWLPGDCGSDPARPEEAYAALIAPLRDKIRNKRLMIVPYGDLHLVPFGALYDAQKRRYLIEDFTIVYVPSASALRLLHDRESPVEGRALIMGDPDASLHGANDEVQRVAAMLGTTARTGMDASEDLVHRLDGHVDLLHIAAHGAYDPADPSFSAISLAPAGEWNGRLTVDEIRDDVDLSGVNLVVIMACQSGMGHQTGGDDVVGLTRALLYAGSPAVISALWKIDDVATTVLIEKFYACLLAGSAPAAALRDAQLALLRDEQYNAPHFWAAFLLTGDPTAEWTAFAKNTPGLKTVRCGVEHDLPIHTHGGPPGERKPTCRVAGLGAAREARGSEYLGHGSGRGHVRVTGEDLGDLRAERREILDLDGVGRSGNDIETTTFPHPHDVDHSFLKPIDRRAACIAVDVDAEGWLPDVVGHQRVIAGRGFRAAETQ
jgi:tetratricopeptide (TPR) repeat protein